MRTTHERRTQIKIDGLLVSLFGSPEEVKRRWEVERASIQKKIDGLLKDRAELDAMIQQLQGAMGAMEHRVHAVLGIKRKGRRSTTQEKYTAARAIYLFLSSPPQGKGMRVSVRALAPLCGDYRLSQLVDVFNRESSEGKIRSSGGTRDRVYWAE